ncbi:MAG: hypothetical protein DLM70_16230 [Chloroflexi bacterium]|nr:MAG: hypothetical protein DLM70_16230 [Chloroflexota bacterium]
MLLPLGCLFLLVALALGGLRLAGLQMPWETSVCGDPTAVCWTHGYPVYTAIVRRDMRGGPPDRTAMIATLKALNTGPAIPHLIAVINIPAGGRIVQARGTVNGGYGTRELRLRLQRDRHRRYLWDLGSLPDGSVAALTISFMSGQPDISWAQARLYGDLRRPGVPSKPVELDRATLRS